MLTFASGGWVLLVSALIAFGSMAWVLIRAGGPLLGDGENVETYMFNLETCLVPREQIVAGGVRKDALRALVDPPTIPGAHVAQINDAVRGKFLVSTDRVIGVDVNGETRAYPLLILNCHEIVNDVLGGVPIAVTYNPLCDSVLVFDRRVKGETLEFGVSGLLYNSNLLMFDRRDEVAQESLWCQITHEAITGSAAAEGRRLTQIPATLIGWVDWLNLHVDTTVIDRDPLMVPRYEQISGPYARYLRSGELKFPVARRPPTDGPRKLKEPIIAIGTPGGHATWSFGEIKQNLDDNRRWRTDAGGEVIEFEYYDRTNTIRVRRARDGQPALATYCLWFAWYAMG